MNDLTVIDVYKFPNYAPEIYCDEFGNFFWEKSNAVLEKKYYNGRICIQVGAKRYGIKKLRINAIKSKKEQIINPF